MKSRQENPKANAFPAATLVPHRVLGAGQTRPGEKLNIAKRVGDPIQRDGVNLKITNQPEANRYVQTEYRRGWSLQARG